MRTLFFDIGNVLVTFDFAKAMRRLATESPHPAEEIDRRLRPMIEAMECGRLGAAAFVEQGRATTEFGGSSEDFIAAYCDIFEENPPMIRLVEAVADDVDLYLLSNTSSLHLDYLQAAYPVFDFFRGGAFSHHSQSSKPDPKIYRDLLALSGCEPSQTLYIDDASANTAAGAAHGLHVFTYDWKDHAAFETEYTRRGWLPL